MMPAVVSILCGSLVGFALGLIGGGGSILATPLLLYVVGIAQPHIAIGTGAVAVAVAALTNFAGHAAAGNVRWRNAAIFAAVGVAGALAGSTLGKAFDGQKLLFLFGLLMVVVGVLMLRSRDVPKPAYETRSDGAVAGLALAAGTASGFFGIGGGFLIVPCLLFATRMPMIDAVGSSLLAVSAFSVGHKRPTTPGRAWWGLADRRLVHPGRRCRRLGRPRRRRSAMRSEGPAPARLLHPDLRGGGLRPLSQPRRDDRQGPDVTSAPEPTRARDTGCRATARPPAFATAAPEVAFALDRCDLGVVLVATTERGLCAILLGDDPDALVQDLRRRFPEADVIPAGPTSATTMAEVIRFVEAPSRGLALALDIGRHAFPAGCVAGARSRSRLGTTATYAEVARAIGRPAAVRAVAAACAANAIAVAIPCHRVVRSDGSLSGYRWGLARKRRLLASEGGWA